MPDLTILAFLALLLAAAALGVALTRNYYANRYADLAQGHTIVQADRDRLLEALGNLWAAVHNPSLNLHRAVRDAEKAVDGRWTA